MAHRRKLFTPPCRRGIRNRRIHRFRSRRLGCCHHPGNRKVTSVSADENLRHKPTVTRLVQYPRPRAVAEMKSVGGHQ